MINQDHVNGIGFWERYEQITSRYYVSVQRLWYEASTLLNIIMWKVCSSIFLSLFLMPPTS